MSDVAEIIMNLRMDAGLSQAELARKVGISGAFLSSIESGKKLPSPATIQGIASIAAPVGSMISVIDNMCIASSQLPHDIRMILVQNPHVWAAVRGFVK